MNDKDVALFHQAEQLARCKQEQAAHEIFCTLAERNSEIEILFWIATTSIDPIEAGRTIETIKQRAPRHPRLRELERFHHRKLQAISHLVAPILLCHSCGERRPVQVKKKISIVGWVWIAASFLLFLYCLLTQVPTAAFLFLFVGAIGFFIRECSYTCGSCGSLLGDATGRYVATTYIQRQPRRDPPKLKD